MKKQIKTYPEFKHVQYKIVTDEDAENPRDWQDTLSLFYSPSSRRYITGGKKDLQISEMYGSDNLAREIRQLKRAGAVVVEFENPNVGTCYAVVERKNVLKEYGNDSRKSLYLARQVAKGEIYEYLSWASGESYAVVITRKDTGEQLDFCGTCYGRNEAESVAQEIAQGWEQNLAQDAKLVEDRLEFVTR